MSPKEAKVFDAAGLLTMLDSLGLVIVRREDLQRLRRIVDECDWFKQEKALTLLDAMLGGGKP